MVQSGSLYMFADDKTDLAIAQLNKALHEVYTWWQNNQLTPHLGKSEVMLLSTRNLIGPIVPALLRGSNLRWVSKTRLLRLTFDEWLTQIPHVREIKNFAIKLDLLKRCTFLPTKVLRDLYFKVTLPSVQYGLILWGACSNSDLFCSIERWHCRAARNIFNFPKDMASCDVLERDHWPTLYLPYTMDILKLFYKAHNETLPELLSKNVYSKRSNGYSLRRDDSQFKKILDIWKIPLPIEVQSCGTLLV